MANFEYTYASWDRLRPATMPKTGLGKALKDYEQSRAQLERGRSVSFYEDASLALGAVERVRAKVVKDYGKNIVFKKAVAALNAAPIVQERKDLAKIVGDEIRHQLVAAKKEAAQHKVGVDARLESLREAEANYEQGREHSKQLKTRLDAIFANKRAGRMGLVGGSGTSANITEFLRKRKVFDKLLPDVLEECQGIVKVMKRIETAETECTKLIQELAPKWQNDRTGKFGGR